MIETTMVDADVYLKYLPSVIASAAVCLARYSLGQEAWVSFLCLSDIDSRLLRKKNNLEYASIDFSGKFLSYVS